MLKEAINTSTDIPNSAHYLQVFVENVMEQTGIKIEYGDDSLKKDTWALDVCTNQEYKARIQERLTKGDDLFSAIMDDFQEFGAGEPDVDLYQRSINVKKFLVEQKQKLDPNGDEKILVISHGRICRSLISSGLNPDKSDGFKGSCNINNCHILPLFIDHNKKVWSMANF